MMLQIIRDGMSHYVNVVQYRFPGPPQHIKDLIPDPRGALSISSDGDDRMGAKVKTPKNP